MTQPLSYKQWKRMPYEQRLFHIDSSLTVLHDSNPFAGDCDTILFLIQQIVGLNIAIRTLNGTMCISFKDGFDFFVAGIDNADEHIMDFIITKVLALRKTADNFCQDAFGICSYDDEYVEVVSAATNKRPF